MNQKEYLNEEDYLKGKKKIKRIALVILLIGIAIGGGIIAIGLNKQNEINQKYSSDSKSKLMKDAETEKENLIKIKEELEAKIKPTKDEIKKLQRETFTGFDDAYYERQDKIEELQKSIASDEKTLSIINGVLEDADFACSFDAKKNATTSKYCSYVIALEDIDSDFNRGFASSTNIPFYMIGGFVIIASCMIAGSIYMITKRREITAFTTQQIMPVAKEGIDKMAPTIGNVAKEITKGIKDGLKDEEKDK